MLFKCIKPCSSTIEYTPIFVFRTYLLKPFNFFVNFASLHVFEIFLLHAVEFWQLFSGNNLSLTLWQASSLTCSYFYAHVTCICRSFDINFMRIVSLHGNIQWIMLLLCISLTSLLSLFSILPFSLVLHYYTI